MKKKVIAIIIVIILIIIAIVGGFIIHKNYVNKQRIAINQQLDQMNVKVKTTKKNFNHKNNGKEDLVNMGIVLDENIANLKLVETNSYNTVEMKEKESKMMEAFNGGKALIALYNQDVSASNIMSNSSAVPTPSDLNKIITIENNILQGENIKVLKVAEQNSYFTDVWGKKASTVFTKKAKEIITKFQKALVMESFFGMK